MDYSGTVLRSTDGMDWTALASSTGTFGNEFSASFFADGKYWFSVPGDPYTTVDGTSWTRLQSLASIQPANALNRAPDGVSPPYLAAGADYASLVASTNGTDWSIAVLGAAASGNTGVQWPYYRIVLNVSNEWVISAQGGGSPGANAGPSDRYGVAGGGIWIPGASQGQFIRNADGDWRRGRAQIISDAVVTTNGVLACTMEGGALQQMKAGFLTGADFALAQPTALPVQTRITSRSCFRFR